MKILHIAIKETLEFVTYKYKNLTKYFFIFGCQSKRFKKINLIFEEKTSSFHFDELIKFK